MPTAIPHQPANLLLLEGCHEHTPAKIEREHREEGIRDFQACIACHPTGHEEEGEGDDD